MSEEIVLFDLPSTGRCACWSLSPWKPRLILNHKGIPYRTQWLWFQEIEPTFKSLGIPPGKEWKKYTIPAVQLPDGSHVMGSMPIAKRLEALYPSPSLHFDTGVPEKVQAVVDPASFAILPFLMGAARKFLTDSDRKHFEADRAAGLRMTIEEWEEKNGGEAGWKAAEPALHNLVKVLKENKQDEGPFVLGSKVCYGDFVAAAMFEWAKRIDTDVYERLMSFDEVFLQIHEACKPWFERDDH